MLNNLKPMILVAKIFKATTLGRKPGHIPPVVALQGRKPLVKIIVSIHTALYILNELIIHHRSLRSEQEKVYTTIGDSQLE